MSTTTSVNSAKAEFSTAIKLAGLVLEGDPIMDGQFHRLPVVGGKANAKDGTYVGFLDGRPSGHIQNFRSGHKETWTTDGPQLNSDDRMLRVAQMQLAKERRAAALVEQHRQAAVRVQARWDKLPEPRETSPNAYLSRKGVLAHGVRFDGDVLVVPARDINGKLWSLQYIAPNEGSSKLFEKSARKAGTMHVLGEIKEGVEILVSEGYATAASLYQASGKAVVVAFDSSGLDPVAGALKQRYPTSPIFIMGDDDRQRHPNVGVGKALAAAREHGVGVAFPRFQTNGRGTDFNDLHAIEGLPAVRAQVENALKQPIIQPVDQIPPSVATPAPDRATSVGPLVLPARSVADEPAKSGLPTAERFSVVVADRNDKPTQQQRTDDAELAMRTFVKQSQQPFGQELGRSSYVGLTDREGHLDSTKVYEGFDVYNTRFATDEGRAAHERIVRGLSAVRYPVEQSSSEREAASRSATASASPPIVPDERATGAALGVYERRPQRAELDLRDTIDRRNADIMAIPRDAVARSETREWVEADLAALQLITDPRVRREASNTMGHNAQEQINYKAELAAQAPDVSKSVAVVFREVQRSRFEAARPEPWQQAFEADSMFARHAALKTEKQAIADLSAEKIERLASEDFHALTVLRGHDREGEARTLANEGLKNVAYRSVHERDAAEASRPDPARLVGPARGEPNAWSDTSALAPRLPVNSIQYADRDNHDAYSLETAALRIRLIAGRPSPAPAATAARANDVDADIRRAQAIAQMHRPELDAYAKAVQSSDNHLAESILRSATRRVEAETDQPAARSTLPPIKDRFNVISHVGRREYHFRDQPGRVAFTERWLSMQSTVDTPAVVKAMVDRAQERGWAAVRIKGAPEFERQAWIAATARGIKAVGYQPTDLDRAAANEERERLAREGGDRGALSGGIITRESQREHAVGDRTNPSTPESPIATVDPLGGPSIARPLTAFLKERGDAPQDVEAVVLAASGLVRGERVYVGRLVDHNADRYKFDPKNDQNYYVKLQTLDGEKTVWGVDLKRAIMEGDIKTGSNVVLEYRGMQPVTVKTKDYDAAGRVVGMHEVEARRNTWWVADLDQLRGLADHTQAAAPERQSGAARSSAEPSAAISARPAADRATPTAATLPRRAKPALVQEPKARDASVLALLEAAFESRNVPVALRDHLRNAVSKGLSERKARGQVSRVKVYDPSAARQVPRAVIPPQQQRDAQERSR